MKSRLCNHNTYPTTIITENKWNKGQKLFEQGCDIIYVFNFLDGIYYLEYDQQDYLVKRAGRCDRGKAEIKYHIFIPIRDLKKLE